MLLLKNYLGLKRTEKLVCPACVDLLNFDGLEEHTLKERNPEAFAVSWQPFFLLLPFLSHSLFARFSSLFCALVDSFESSANMISKLEPLCSNWPSVNNQVKVCIGIKIGCISAFRILSQPALMSNTYFFSINIDHT